LLNTSLGLSIFGGAQSTPLRTTVRRGFTALLRTNLCALVKVIVSKNSDQRKRFIDVTAAPAFLLLLKTSHNRVLTCSVRKPAVDARRPLRKAPVDGHAR